MIISAALLGSCSKSDEPTGAVEAFRTSLITGTWVVGSHTQYEPSANSATDTLIDDTNDYSGYVLHFNTNGSVTASRDNNITRGNWTVENQIILISGPLGYKDKPLLDLNFEGPPLFQTLSTSWLVQTSLANEKDLFDYNGATRQSLIFRRG